MQATLIYNPNARSINSVTPEQLLEALKEAGYHPIYKTTNSEEDLDSALAGVEGLVVVAGGDGTLRAVAIRILNKNVSLTPLPLGTANNISQTLDIKGEPLEIVKGLKNPRKRAFDVGRIRGPWGESYFLEGAGWGFFADILADYKPEAGKDMLRGVASAIKTISEYTVYPSRMALDGRDISGDYILVEILNTVAIGPRLKLAPQANPGDGLLDVVRVSNHFRDGIIDYGLGLIAERLHEMDSVQVDRGRKLELEWPGFHIHFDAELPPQVYEYVDNSPELSAIGEARGQWANPHRNHRNYASGPEILAASTCGKRRKERRLRSKAVVIKTLAQSIGAYDIEFIFAVVIWLVAAIILLWRLFERHYPKIWKLIKNFWQFLKTIPLIQRLEQRYPQVWRFLHRRLSPEGYLGLHLTLGLLLIFITVAAFNNITIAVLENNNIVRFDEALAVALHQNTSPAEVEFLRVITAFAGRTATFVIGGGVAVALLIFRKKVLLVSWAVAILGDSLLNAGLKLFFQRARPEFTNPFLTEQNWSFPSGHSMGAVVMYGMLAYLLMNLFGSYINKLLLLGLVVTLVVLIGFSRMQLGAHFFSDVIAGFVAGGGWLVIVITGTEVVRRRRKSLESRASSKAEKSPQTTRTSELSTKAFGNCNYSAIPKITGSKGEIRD